MDSESEGQAQYRADADAGVSGQVVVGDHILVVRSEGGSVVMARTGEPPRVERRVPPDAGSLRPRPLGRERELTAIVQALDDGLAVQIHGGDGSGRTTVLRHLAQLRGGDRDVLFLSARGLAIDDLLQTLFDACFDSFDTDGYRPEPSVMRTLMEPVRALLLVDDFDGDAEDLKALLDAAPAGGIVVVSREPTLMSGGFALELSGLDEAAGIALLARELGRNMEAEELADATEVWRAAGGNPLALVQAAAAVRETGGTLAEFRDSEQMAQALARNLTEPQQQVLGILYLIGTAPTPAAFLTALGGAPYEAAIERLRAAGLVTEEQPRIAGHLAGRVAAIAAAAVAPARLAETITAWLASGLDRRLAGESAPLILQVLRATMAAGGYQTAVRLARVASPKLAMALHLGAWGILLELGHSTARAANAADEPYFAHESAARRQILGEATTAEALDVTAPVLSIPFPHPDGKYRNTFDTLQAPGVDTAAAGTPPPPAIEPPAVSRRGNIRRLAAKPALWVVVTIAATIAFTAFTALTDFGADDRPQAAPAVSSTIAPTTSTSPPMTSTETTTTAEPTTLVTTSVPAVTSASISASASASASAPATRPTSGAPPGNTTTNPPSGCVSSVGALGFAPVAVGGSQSLIHSFRSPACLPNGLNTGNMSIQGANPSAFSFSLVSCPNPTTYNTTDRCTIAVTFHPSTPGDFSAKIHIPAAGATAERSYAFISLSGHAG